MRRHLLLDLDGTLLGIRMGVFIPRLMSAILEHFTPFMPSTTFFPSMKTALKAMLGNEDPSRTVMEAFLETFSGLSGMPLEEATTIAIISRLWFITGEVFIFFLSLVLNKFSLRRTAE